MLSRETSSVATVTAALSDILQGRSTQPLAVDQGVDEAQAALSLTDPVVVQQRKNRGESRSGSRSAIDKVVLTTDLDDVAGTLGCNVGVSTTLLVVETLVFLVERLDVVFDDFVLVGGALEVVGETSTRVEAAKVAVYSDFRAEVLSSSHSSSVRARSGESGEELTSTVLVDSSVANALSITSNARITRRVDGRNTTSTKGHDVVANPLGISARDSLLVITVRSGEDLREVLVPEREEVVHLKLVRLVGVVDGGSVRCEGRRTSGSVVGERDGEDESTNSFNI